MRVEEQSALDKARQLASLRGADWLRPDYRWLEEQWRG